MTKSGQKTVATAGTAVVLGSEKIGGPLAVKALAGNTDIVYIGNVEADVSSSNGFELSAGEVIVFNQIEELDDLWIDAAVNGEGVCWIALEI